MVYYDSKYHRKFIYDSTYIINNLIMIQHIINSLIMNMLNISYDLLCS